MYRLLDGKYTDRLNLVDRPRAVLLINDIVGIVLVMFIPILVINSYYIFVFSQVTVGVSNNTETTSEG